MVNVNYMCSWTEHSSHFFSSITSLRNADTLTDVTITCADKQFKAHRLVLCASSEYFRRILSNNLERSAFVHIMGVPPIYIANLLQYLYTGQIEITPSDVEPFLKVANELKISGLYKEDSEEQNPRLSRSPGERVPPLNLDNLPLHMREHFMSNLSVPTIVQHNHRAVGRPFDRVDGHMAPGRPFEQPDGLLTTGRPFEQTDGLLSCEGEQITIMPDIVDMSDNYDNIREDTKENIISASCEQALKTTGANCKPGSDADKSFKINLSSLAVDPANSSKRRGSSDLEPAEKRGKKDSLPVKRIEGTESPQTHLSPTVPFIPITQMMTTPLVPVNSPLSSLSTPLTTIPCPLNTSLSSPRTSMTSPLSSTHYSAASTPGIRPVSCKKGHTGGRCNHAIVSLPDGRKVHYNQRDYDKWIEKNEI